MRKLVCASAILMALAGGAARLEASPAPAGEEYITVEIVLGDRFKTPGVHRVPIADGPRPPQDDRVVVGGLEYTGSCDEKIGCGVLILMTADRATDDSSRVVIDLRYKDKKKCSETKEVTVVRGEPTELKIKCGAVVKAYYDPRPKGAN